MTHPVPEVVTVVVVRTGGFAGLRREWRAQPSGASVRRWAELVERCPWQEHVDAAPAAADRFVWHITARVSSGERHTELAESQLHGPWRELVSEVQAFESRP